MKFIYLILLTLAALSCSKNEGFSIEDANEKAAGYYQYLSITWKGPAIDLNGDGVLNSDILKEYEGASECERILKSKEAGIIRPLSSFSDSKPIFIEIPAQGIKLFKPANKQEWKSGAPGQGMPFALSPSYSYERSGAFKFNCQKATLPTDWGHEYEELDTFSNLEILSISDGVLVFKVDYTLYDFATKSKVTAPLYAVMLRTMKRVRY